jgi:gp16 family phage-associated protein
MLHRIKRYIPLSMAVVGSEDTYLTVRSALVARGTTLNAWCKANGLNRQTVEKSLKGQRHSRNGAEIRYRLVEELFGKTAE